MKKKIVRESITAAEPATRPTPAPAKPQTEPGTLPSTRPAPGRPDPFRKNRPSVDPRPKATAEDIAKRTLELAKKDKELKDLLKKKYSKK